MRDRRFVILSCVLGLFVAAAACGGPSDVPPQPLSTHFDDMYIAQVPLEQKQAMIEAQNEYSVAKLEKAKAEADWNASATDIEVARNERQAALLDEKSALSRKKAADDSGDQNRVNTAAREVRAAELSRRASDVKVEWLNAHRTYLKRFVRYTEENTYAKEARFEMAKAKVARDNNIKPKGFDFAVYERQAAERSRRTQEAKVKADREKQTAETKRKAWEQQKREAEKMGAPTGGPTSVPRDEGGEMPGTEGEPGEE
jgi:hypothetical protein